MFRLLFESLNRKYIEVNSISDCYYESNPLLRSRWWFGLLPAPSIILKMRFDLKLHIPEHPFHYQTTQIELKEHSRYSADKTETLSKLFEVKMKINSFVIRRTRDIK